MEVRAMTDSLSSRPRLILIVDEDYPVTASLVPYFMKQGYTTAVAANGADALASALATPPSLVLLSTRLPDGPGRDVFKKLRERARTATIPVMFLAAVGDSKLQNELLSEGADDFIAKPFDVDILGLRVRNAIKRQDREGLNHPRTGLSTGRLITERVRALADEDNWFKVDFIIDNFAAFREQYGFMTGEEVIVFTAHLLNDVVQSAGTADDFIGHKDDTEFVVITDLAHGPQLRDLLEKRFNEEVLSFYGFVEREQGFTEVPDGNGGTTKKPLMSAKIKVQQGEPI
jgi:PleD family two-component response regulator